MLHFHTTHPPGSFSSISSAQAQRQKRSAWERITKKKYKPCSEIMSSTDYFRVGSFACERLNQGMEKRTRKVDRAVLMTLGETSVSANVELLVLGGIEADFSKRNII